MLEFVRLLTAMQTSDKNGIATLEGGQPGDNSVGPGAAATVERGGEAVDRCGGFCGYCPG